MGRIELADYAAITAENQKIWDSHVERYGRMTNMKKTLAHSENSLRGLMEWYPLKEEVSAFVGERGAFLFSHAISSATDCLICSTFFRKILIERGEDPDNLVLSQKEEGLVKLGRVMAKQQALSNEEYNELFEGYSEKERVALVAFGAMMIATNVFNNIMGVDLDEYLLPFLRKK